MAAQHIKRLPEKKTPPYLWTNCKQNKTAALYYIYIFNLEAQAARLQFFPSAIRKENIKHLTSQSFIVKIQATNRNGHKKRAIRWAPLALFREVDQWPHENSCIATFTHNLLDLLAFVKYWMSVRGHSRTKDCVPFFYSPRPNERRAICYEYETETQ